MGYFSDDSEAESLPRTPEELEALIRRIAKEEAAARDNDLYTRIIRELTKMEGSAIARTGMKGQPGYD